MLQHGERIKLVRGIHIRTMNALGNDAVRLAGIYGSTAGGYDTPLSDIEMLYVIYPGAPSGRRTFLYQGIPIEIQMISWDELCNQLTNPNLQTPYLMGSLKTLQLLHGEIKDVEYMLDAYQKMDRSAVETFFLNKGSEVAVESYHKIHAISRRGNKQELPVFLFEMLHEMHLALALINRALVTKGYYVGVKQGFAWEKLPNEYQACVEGLWKAEDLTTTIKLADRLLASFRSFLQEEGYRVRDLQKLDELNWQDWDDLSK